MLGWYSSALPGYPGFSGLQENQKQNSLALWLCIGLHGHWPGTHCKMEWPGIGNACSATVLCLKDPEASISTRSALNPCCSNFGSLGENCRISDLEQKPILNPGVPEFHPAKWLPQVFYQYLLEVWTSWLKETKMSQSRIPHNVSSFLFPGKPSPQQSRRGEEGILPAGRS